MKDEIKEINLIIRHFIDVKEGRAFTNLTFKQTMILLDYITNLQKLQQAKDKLQNDYQEAVDKITNLQEENEKFKEYARSYLKSKIDRLNNIISELEKWLNEEWHKPLATIYVSDVVKKLKELKEKE